MNEKKKRSVIGYLTLSVGLIAIGLFILLFIFHVGHLLWVAYLGPLLIILLGLEWIYATYRQSGPRRLSVLATVFVIILCLVSVGVAGVSRLNIQWGLQNFTGTQLVHAFAGPEQQVPFDESHSVADGIRVVHIMIPNGKVTVTGGATGTVHDTGTFYAKTSDASSAKKMWQENWSVSTSGDTMTLALKRPSDQNWMASAGMYMTVNISMPKSLHAVIDTTNAQIQVDSIENGVEANATNGDVKISDVKGSVQVITTNGVCQVNHAMGPLDAQTTNGLITVKEVSGSVQLHTTNGKISLDSSTVGGNWTIATTNGPIDVGLPTSADLSLQASTDNGGFNGNVAWQKQGKHHATCVLGDGRFQGVFSTTNGPISVSTNS